MPKYFLKWSTYDNFDNKLVSWHFCKNLSNNKILILTDALAEVLMNRVCSCSGGSDDGAVAAGPDGAISGCGLKTNSTSVTSSEKCNK